MAEVATLRHVLINDSRKAAIDEAFDFVSCGQADGHVAFYNTSTGARGACMPSWWFVASRSKTTVTRRRLITQLIDDHRLLVALLL